MICENICHLAYGEMIKDVFEWFHAEPFKKYACQQSREFVKYNSLTVQIMLLSPYETTCNARSGESRC
jgi:hypothetical protein